MGTVLRWRAKDMTITTVIINPRQEMSWSGDDVMPGRDGPENLRILKKNQLRLDGGGRELGLLPLRHVVKFCRSLPTEILNTTRCAARGGGVR